MDKSDDVMMSHAIIVECCIVSTVYCGRGCGTQVNGGTMEILLCNNQEEIFI